MAAFPAEWPMPWGEGDEAMSHIGFTAPFNLSGQPAGTVNAGFTADGRTVGLQVSGRRFDDVGVLRALQWFEQHRPHGAEPRWPIPDPTRHPARQPSGVPRWQTASTLLPSGSRTNAP